MATSAPMIISENSLNFVPEICQIVKQGLQSQGTGPGAMGLLALLNPFPDPFLSPLYQRLSVGL